MGSMGSDATTAATGPARSAPPAATAGSAAAAKVAVVKPQRQIWQEHKYPRFTTVEEAAQHLDSVPLPVRQVTATGMRTHVRLVPHSVDSLHGAPVVLALKAFERCGKLHHTLGREQAHSRNLVEAAADPVCGSYALAVMCGVTAAKRLRHNTRWQRHEWPVVSSVAEAAAALCALPRPPRSRRLERGELEASVHLQPHTLRDRSGARVALTLLAFQR